MDIKAARKWYNWLWFSPFLTLPTLALFSWELSEVPSILVSAGWHLLLLIPILDKEDEYVSWHGKQAMALAGLRTLLALIFHDYEGIAFFLVLIVWFFGTLWGQRQANTGKCTLAQWWDISFDIAHLEESKTRISAEPIKVTRTKALYPRSDKVYDEKAVSVKKEASSIVTPVLPNSQKLMSHGGKPLCPKCGVPEKSQEITCASCEESFMNEDLLMLRQLEYLVSETKNWRGVKVHRAPYVAKLLKLRERLFPPQQAKVEGDPQELAKELASLQAFYDLSQRWVWSGKLSPSISTALKKLNEEIDPQIAALSKALTGQGVKLKKNSEEDAIRFGLDSLGEWEKFLPSWDIAALRDHLKDELTKRTRPVPAPIVGAPPAPQPVPAKAVAVTVAKPAVKKIAPAPRPTPKAKRPSIQWGKIWEKSVEMVVSGALLRGLLYLGAFMIVVSATILVVRFWDVFPEVLQLVLIFSVPTIFYLLGWVVRNKLKLPQAGDVLTGIGALLVAVDFAAVYQFGGVEGRIDGNAYWLIVSIICLIVYGITTWRVRGGFFDYLTLLGIGSTVLAFTRLLAIPYEWSVVVMTATAVTMICAATRLSKKEGAWLRFSQAARYLPQIAILASMIFVSFIPGASAWAQMMTFLFAAFGYVLLAWKFPAAIFAHAASWTMIGAVVFALFAVDLRLEWYATAGSVLAIPYLLGGKFLEKKFNISEETESEKKPWQRGYLLALNIAGFGLTSLSALAGIIALYADLWAGVVGLSIISLILAGSAWLYKKPFLLVFGAGLFNIPFLFAVHRLLEDAQSEQAIIWMMAAWPGLALAYLGFSYLLRKAEKYAQMLLLCAQLIVPLLLVTLLFNYDPAFSSAPILIALGGTILFYTISAFLHDGERLPALSTLLKEILPSPLNESLFIWAVGFLSILWTAAAWTGSIYPQRWMGAVFAGLALGYVALGQIIAKRNKNYSLPLHFYTYALIFLGILQARSEHWSLLTTLYLGVMAFIALAFVYRRKREVILASLLFLFPFELSLELSPFTEHGYTLAYLLLAIIVYIPIGLWLSPPRGEMSDRTEGGKKLQLAIPLLVTGYSVSTLALIASILGRFDAYPINLPWIGVLVPVLAAALYIFSVYRFQKSSILRNLFASIAALTFAIAFGQALTLFKVPEDYLATAWVGLGFVYLLLERGINWKKKKSWLSHFRLPLDIGSAAFTALSLLLTLPFAVPALLGNPPENLFPAILAQSLVVVFLALAAGLYRSHLPLFLEPFVAFFPFTLAFIAYTEITTLQFGVAWSGLAIIHFVVAILLDKNRIRYAHGLYLGTYTLALFAIFWTLLDPVTLSWTLGLGILVAIVSAFLIHHKGHLTWGNLLKTFFGNKDSLLRTLLHTAFFWFIAWSFPYWLFLLFRQIPEIINAYTWIGYVVGGVILLGTTVWLRKFEGSYAWAFYFASQVYVAWALYLTGGDTLKMMGGTLPPVEQYLSPARAFVILQSLAVVFYAFSAWVFQKRRIYYPFSYIAALLSIFPVTLGWTLYKPMSKMVIEQYSWVWMGWATILLLVGYLLDKGKQAQSQGRFAHGAYFVGYLLIVRAIALSTSDLLVHLYTLAGAIILALISHIVVHRQRHHAFDDFVNFFWRKPETIAHRVAQNFFLFFASYAVPVWVAQLLTYHEIELAWRGFVLTLLAPVYIALGMVVRRIKKDYTWALYSAGYALTAIGAMVAFDDLQITIAVLLINAVIYAVSAYLFKQFAWLYLTTTLVPVITLLSLHHADNLNDPWVSKVFMALAFLYFGIGQLFDRKGSLLPEGEGLGVRAGSSINSYATPFYAPAYILSAVALASASGERSLAIPLYLAGSAFYAISAWRFRESLFIYPAAWLLAVPYYLWMTLIPTLEPRYYGLGWLPLIVLYIILGRFVFHKNPIRSPLLAHPAMPFYTLGYALSLSVIALSSADPTTLTFAFAAAAIIYLASAPLFRRAGWLYPGLFAAHLALLSYFTIEPSGGGIHRISLPFLAMTWLMALVGYALSRRFPVATEIEEGKYRFKFWRWDVDFGVWHFVGHLLTPSWAQPFFIFTALDIFIWQSIALPGTNTAIVLATGYALLLGLFAMLWKDKPLTYGSLAFSLLAAGYSFHWFDVTFPWSVAWFGGIGLGFYLLSLGIEQVERRASRLSIWKEPLMRVGIALSAFSTFFSIPFVVSETSATAAALAFAGTLYLAIAYKGKYHRLGYAGMGMLLLAWVLLLVVQDVSQPQWYAIPAGLYFTGMGHFERLRGRGIFAKIIEGFGLAVLLVTSYIQSVTDGAFIYFVILLVEGVLVLWWGAGRRQKLPFFSGMGAIALNVISQVIILMRNYEINRWLTILGVGLLFVTAAIFVERQREKIIARSQEWRETLDTWD